MSKFSFWKTMFLLCVFCAVAAVGSPAQTFTTLVNFNSADGSYPYAGLVQGTDANYYGTTSSGGANGLGTVFRTTSGGAVTTPHSFDGVDGGIPVAPLVLATNGNLYGTTSSGGANGAGTVFEITPAGKLTTLYSFCSQTGCIDGSYPFAGLVQATNGNFYGTTYAGGANYLCDASGCGTVFEITPAGRLTTLYSFCAEAGCIDGGAPDAACGFRGKPITIPGSSRSPFRNDSDHDSGEADHRSDSKPITLWQASEA